jgi:hypothetical protein
MLRRREKKAAEKRAAKQQQQQEHEQQENEQSSLAASSNSSASTSNNTRSSSLPSTIHSKTMSETLTTTDSHLSTPAVPVNTHAQPPVTTTSTTTEDASYHARASPSMLQRHLLAGGSGSNSSSRLLNRDTSNSSITSSHRAQPSLTVKTSSVNSQNTSTADEISQQSPTPLSSQPISTSAPSNQLPSHRAMRPIDTAHKRNSSNVSMLSSLSVNAIMSNTASGGVGSSGSGYDSPVSASPRLRSIPIPEPLLVRPRSRASVSSTDSDAELLLANSTSTIASTTGGTINNNHVRSPSRRFHPGNSRRTSTSSRGGGGGSESPLSGPFYINNSANGSAADLNNFSSLPPPAMQRRRSSLAASATTTPTTGSFPVIDMVSGMGGSLSGGVLPGPPMSRRSVSLKRATTPRAMSVLTSASGDWEGLAEPPPVLDPAVIDAVLRKHNTETNLNTSSSTSANISSPSINSGSRRGRKSRRGSVSSEHSIRDKSRDHVIEQQLAYQELQQRKSRRNTNDSQSDFLTVIHPNNQDATIGPNRGCPSPQPSAQLLSAAAAVSSLSAILAEDSVRLGSSLSSANDDDNDDDKLESIPLNTSTSSTLTMVAPTPRSAMTQRVLPILPTSPTATSTTVADIKSRDSLDSTLKDINEMSKDKDTTIIDTEQPLSTDTLHVDNLNAVPINTPKDALIKSRTLPLMFDSVLSASPSSSQSSASVLTEQKSIKEMVSATATTATTKSNNKITVPPSSRDQIATNTTATTTTTTDLLTTSRYSNDLDDEVAAIVVRGSCLRGSTGSTALSSSPSPSPSLSISSSSSSPVPRRTASRPKSMDVSALTRPSPLSYSFTSQDDTTTNDTAQPQEQQHERTNSRHLTVSTSLRSAPIRTNTVTSPTPLSLWTMSSTPSGSSSVSAESPSSEKLHESSALFRQRSHRSTTDPPMYTPAAQMANPITNTTTTTTSSSSSSNSTNTNATITTSMVIHRNVNKLANTPRSSSPLSGNPRKRSPLDMANNGNNQIVAVGTTPPSPSVSPPHHGRSLNLSVDTTNNSEWVTQLTFHSSSPHSPPLSSSVTSSPLKSPRSRRHSTIGQLHQGVGGSSGAVYSSNIGNNHNSAARLASTLTRPSSGGGHRRMPSMPIPSSYHYHSTADLSAPMSPRHRGQSITSYLSTSSSASSLFNHGQLPRRSRGWSIERGSTDDAVMNERFTGSSSNNTATTFTTSRMSRSSTGGRSRANSRGRPSVLSSTVTTNTTVTNLATPSIHAILSEHDACIPADAILEALNKLQRRDERNRRASVSYVPVFVDTHLDAERYASILRSSRLGKLRHWPATIRSTKGDRTNKQGVALSAKAIKAELTRIPWSNWLDELDPLTKRKLRDRLGVDLPEWWRKVLKQSLSSLNTSKSNAISLQQR